MTRPLRLILIAVAAVVVVVAGGVAVALARFDPDSLKPDIVAAARRATGRELVINGKIGLKLSLTPTIQVADVTFANPSGANPSGTSSSGAHAGGFSRPLMASLQGMELQFALLPLLRHHLQVERLLLVHPDILLETDAAGRPNWQMTPQAPAATPAGGETPSAERAAKTSISVDTVRIQDGLMAFRDGATGKVTALQLVRLDVSAESPESSMRLDVDARLNGTGFTVVGSTGSLMRLQDPAAGSGWPVALVLNAVGGRVAAEGTLTQPLLGKGYDLAINGSLPDAAALAPLLPGVAVPPLRDVTFAAKVVDKGARWPEIAALALHVGASDLGGVVAGLTLAKLDLDAPGAEKPLKATAAGQLAGAPVVLAATLGAPALLLPDAKPAAFPVDVVVQAAGATFAAKGSVADARAMTGAAIVVSAQIPELAALSPLMGRPLPGLRQVAFQGTVSDTPAGLRNGLALHGMRLSSPDLDVAGDATFGWRPRVTLTATLRSDRLDLDALERAPGARVAPGAPTGVAAPGVVAPGVVAPGAPADVAPKLTDRLFSDAPLPFDRLRGADADVRLEIGTLHAGAADTKAVTLHVGLKDGRLAVDRFEADLPGGHLTGKLTADVTQPAPPVHIVLHAPGLAMQSVLVALRQPPLARGNLEVYADLSGAGATPHAIAGSLDGSIGLAVAGGVIDNRLLGSLLGKVMESLNGLDLVGKGGTSELRCLAVRMDARHGIGTVQPLVLNSSLLTMTGGGSVDLGAERLGMTLRPQVRMGGATIVVPVKLAGPIRAPGVAVDRAGAAETNAGAAAGSAAGAAIGAATPLGALAGLFGADKLAGGKGGDPCGAALAMARGQAAPAAPAAVEPGAPGLPGLQGLFR